MRQNVAEYKTNNDRLFFKEVILIFVQNTEEVSEQNGLWVQHKKFFHNEDYSYVTHDSYMERKKSLYIIYYSDPYTGLSLIF